MSKASFQWNSMNLLKYPNSTKCHVYLGIPVNQEYTSKSMVKHTMRQAAVGRPWAGATCVSV